MTRTALRALCVVAAIVCDTQFTVSAATATASFQVSITIQAACQVTSTNNLDFGTHGLLTSDIDDSTTIAVQCTNTTAYDIGLDKGLGAGATVGVRKMTGPASATIGYSLYSDGALSTVWGDTISTDTVHATGTGSDQSYTIFGRVPPQATPAAGVFTDTITVTLTF